MTGRDNMNYAASGGDIKSKLMWVNFGVVLLVMAFLSVIIYMRENDEMRLRISHIVGINASIVAHNSRAPLLFMDQERAVELLSSFESMPNIEYAVLFDADGRMFAQYTLGGKPLVDLPEDYKGFEGGGFREGMYLLYSKIADTSGEVIGALLVVSNISEIKRELNEKLFIVALVLMASLVITLLMLSAALRMLFKPLWAMHHAIERVTHEGNYGVRVEVVSDDEIGSLGVGFNKMLDRIEEREAELLENQRRLKDEMDRRSAIEEQLLQAQKMEAMGQLAGGLAHDFNNIAATIMNLSSLAQYRIDRGEPAGKYIQEIMKSCERAADLTSSLLTFSRNDSVKMQPVALEEVVKDFVRLVPSITGSMIGASLSLEGEAPFMVKANRSQVELVLINLALNARDAAGDSGGVISIGLGRVGQGHMLLKKAPLASSGRYVCVKFSDNGSGMPPEVLERVYEPFFTTKEPGRGTGLGLSMVYSIVKNHGGFIHLESEVGRGTDFYVCLPEVSDSSLEAAGAARASSGMGHETILIAEDSAEMRQGTREILESYGYRIIEACDGDEAVKLYAENREGVSLLLLDVVMPGRTGFRAYDTITGEHGPVPAVFLTGYFGEGEDLKRYDPSMVRLLLKPARPEEIVTAIRELLD